MKYRLLGLFVTHIAIPSLLWADSTPPATSTTTVVVSTAPERGVTEPTGRDIFVTLTRTAFPVSELPTTADVVKPHTFKMFDAQNAGEVVARQTSVQTLPVGQLGAIITARIRGSSSAQTLVMIDGRPVSGVSLGTPDLSEIPIENIDHVEILRGGISSLYGPNAMGGVINVITKRATYAGKPISNVGYESRSYGHQLYRLDFGSRYGPVDYFFYGNQQWESGFRDNSDARTHNIGGNAGFSMGAAGKLLFDVSSYHGEAGAPGTACGPNDLFCLNAPASYLMPNQYNNKDEKLASTYVARSVTDTNYLRSSYILPLPANTLLTLRAFGSQRELDYNDAADPNPFNATSTDRHESSKGGEVQYNMPWGLTAGGSFIHDREDNTDRLAPGNSFDRWIENYGFYAQEEFHYRRLTLIPSGRYDHNSQVGETKNPRVQMMADATDWLRFSGSAGRSFRAPTIDDLFLQIGGAFPFTGNPNLRPETAWVYDAGFEVHPDSFSLKATYFRTNVKDLIQVEPITFSTVVNIGTARRQGMELQIDHAASRYFKHGVNYTYLENLGIPSGFNHLVPLPFSPRHTVNYLASLMPATRWKIDNTLRFEDVRYSGNNQTGTKMGAQLLWDMRLSYQLRQLELYLGVNDITDKRYQEQAGFPLPGRTAYGGLTLRLWE